MKYADFKRLVTEVLTDLNMIHTPDAVELLCMIAAEESGGGAYNWQGGGGTALGPLQMEPATHDDCWANADNIGLYAQKLGIAKRDASYMARSYEYAIFMARFKLKMIPAALPSKADPHAMAAYAKLYWNSPKGAATIEGYYNAWYSWSGNWKPPYLPEGKTAVKKTGK